QPIPQMRTQPMDSQLEALLVEDDLAAAGLVAARIKARVTHVDCLAAAVQAVQQGAQDYLSTDQVDEYPPLLGRSLRYAVERQRILMIAAQVDHLKERERQLTQLNEMGELLQVSASADEAYRIIVRTGATLFSSAAEIGGGLAILAPSDVVEVVASWGNVGCGAATFARQDCWAL